MRITFINRLAGVLQGGGERFDLEVARALRKLDHQVEFVIGRRWSKLDIPMMEFPTTYVRTPYLRWLMYRGEASQSRLLKALGSRAMWLDLDMFERMALKKIIENNIVERTDVFQINGLPRLGAWLRQKLHANTVIVWHGPPWPTVRRWNELCSGTFAFGDALAAVRNNADSRAVEIPPGVDISLFRRIPAEGLRKHYQIPTEGIVFLFVGRMIPIKNLSFLIESFALAVQQNSFLYLLLVGDGPSKSKLFERVSVLGLEDHVIFAGRQTGEALVAHYSAADAFTITSTYENFPFVIIEAMACELPVVATRVGGIPNLVEAGQTGMLVESDNVESLRSALLVIAEDTIRRQEMGHRGREKVVRQYNWMETARKMVALYQDIHLNK